MSIEDFRMIFEPDFLLSTGALAVYLAGYLSVKKTKDCSRKHHKTCFPVIHTGGRLESSLDICVNDESD